MLELFRVPEPNSEEFSNWLRTSKANEISRMRADDNSVVFIVRNLANLPLANYPAFAKRIPHARYNFEFEDFDKLMSVLEPDDPTSIGADYVYDLIKESVDNARPVTARTLNDQSEYVIVKEGNALRPIHVQ